MTRIISDPKDLSRLSRKDIAVHFSRRPKLSQIVAVLDACPRLQRISIGKSMNATFGPGLRALLEHEGIELLVTNGAHGTRSDLHDGMEEIGDDA
mgnify:CR=1 FL=1